MTKNNLYYDDLNLSYHMPCVLIIAVNMALRLCTWLSTDGGMTWRDVAPSAYIYDYGDYGGVILMAKYSTDGPTNEFLYSLDEGRCWKSIPIEVALKVDNIRWGMFAQAPNKFNAGTSIADYCYLLT